MPYDPDDADYDEDALDRDAPQESDLDREDEDSGYIDCPSCGKTLDEDAACCPACGHWMTEESLAAQRSRGWFWPVMVALLVAMIVVIWARLRW